MLNKVDPFSQELDAACKRFEQGHLLHEARTAYVARPDVVASSWANQFEFLDVTELLAIGGVAPGPEPPFFIILDQTCDVQKKSIPFIHVSPVYNSSRYFGAGDVRKIKDRKGFWYLYGLTAEDLQDLLTPAQIEDQKGPMAPSDWVWVADLRIQVPFDKGILMGRESIPGFARREDQLAFGRELGYRRDRPALPTVVQDYVIPALSIAVEQHEDFLSGVEFRVMADSEAAPNLLQLVLITPHNAVTADKVTALIEPIAHAIEESSGVPCSLRSCGTDLQVNAADYRDSVLLEIELSPED